MGESPLGAHSRVCLENYKIEEQTVIVIYFNDNKYNVLTPRTSSGWKVSSIFFCTSFPLFTRSNFMLTAKVCANIVAKGQLWGTWWWHDSNVLLKAEKAPIILLKSFQVAKFNLKWISNSCSLFPHYSLRQQLCTRAKAIRNFFCQI